MAIPWGLVIFVVGLLYGYLAKGKQDKSDILKRGLIIGLILGLVLAVLGLLVGSPALGVGGGLAVVWSFLILSLLFILGVWLGDLLEGATRK